MNIAHRIAEVARVFPDKKSVVFSKRVGNDQYEYPFYTFSEFESRSNQIANFLGEHGVRPGMRVLLFVKPCLDFSVITFSLFKMGAIPVLIDPGMGMKNLLRSVKQVRPDVLISIGVVHWVRRILRDSFKSIKVLVSLNEVWGRTHYLYKNLASYSKEFTPLDVLPSTHAAILFTSGGTGIPKGVIYTHGILNAQTESLKKMFSLDETQVDLPGFALFALFTLAMGMTSVIPDMDPTRPAQCDPKKIIANINAHNATFVAGSPAIWKRVGEYCSKNKITLPSVKHVVMFGAPVRTEIHQLLDPIIPNGDTFTPYGATEFLPVALISGTEILNKYQLKMNNGGGVCLGKVVSPVEIKIMKVSDIPESQINELPTNTPGEIVVTGPQVTPGYFEMAEETNKAKIKIGDTLWHRMGDLGYLDEENNLWFLGRKGHRVELANETLYSISVESFYNQHPEVSRTSLVSLSREGKVVAGLVIERHDHQTKASAQFIEEISNITRKNGLQDKVMEFFLHPSFPVDVRHNIKIDRVKLGQWATGRKGWSLRKQSG